MPLTRFTYGAMLRESFRQNGVARTVRELASGFWEFLRDSLPARRRLRYGDLDFDYEQRVDTTWSNIGAATRFRAIFSGRGYQATDPVIFAEMMEHVQSDVRDFTFVDLGCGKGRALLLARSFGFRRFIGVELLPELLEAAHRNVDRLAEKERARFELFASDARTYEFPPEPTFLYLFDPFPPAVLKQVLSNLTRSVQEHPRPVLIGYQNPVSEFVLGSTQRFQKLAGTLQWALYAINPRYDRW